MISEQTQEKVNKVFDSEKDPIKWIDLMVWQVFLKGEYDVQMPIDWARERFTIFLDNYTKGRIKRNKKYGNNHNRINL